MAGSVVRPIRALGSLYRTQTHLLWRWSGGWRAVTVRAVLIFLSSLTAFAITVRIVPQLSARDPVGAAGAALALALVSTVTRPVLIALLSGVSVILVGAGTLAVQATALLAIANVSPDLTVDGPRGALVASVVYAVLHTLLAAGLSIANDDSFYGTLVRQLAARRRGRHATPTPGVVFLQIDGLSHPLLLRELDRGTLPTLSRWLRSGAATLEEWEPLLPTQTSASQAGILHGTNDGIPAFRWWEKEGERFLVSNHPRDAREILRRISDGHGLLVGGASIGNLFSGDAERSYLTAATVDDPAREARRSHVLYWFYVSPYAYVRWVILSIGEILKEIAQAQVERWRRIEPRGDRAFPYPLARAGTNVVLRHLVTALVVEEMYRAAPVIYADLVDYDEIAHRAGIARAEAQDALAGIDRIVAIIEKVTVDAPRPYRIVVLSDHGQSPGPMFKDRYGRSLQSVIEGLMDEDTSSRPQRSHGEHVGRVSTLLAEGPSLPGLSAARGVGASGTVHDLVVAASGNLAQVSFPKLPGRATRETIDARYPGLIDGLVAHPGIGLVVVRAATGGSIAIGRSGSLDLGDGTLRGEDPVARYGPHALAGLRRVDAMSTCGDLMVLSSFDPASGEVFAFEDQIGSHGGLGGWQSAAFILHPAEWRLAGPIVGAPELGRALRSIVARQRAAEHAADTIAGHTPP